MFGEFVSMRQCCSTPLSSFAVSVNKPCGLRKLNSSTVPFTVTILSATKCTANEWCAAAPVAAANATKTAPARSAKPIRLTNSFRSLIESHLDPRERPRAEREQQRREHGEHHHVDRDADVRKADE